MSRNYVKIFWAVWFFILVAVHPLYFGQIFAALKPDILSVRVAKVHDGDTVSVVIGQKTER